MKPFSCRFKKNKQLIYFPFKDRMMLFIFYFTLVKLRGEHQVTMQHCDSFVLKLLISGQIHQVTNPHSMYQEMNTSHRCVIKYTILHKRNRSYIRHYSRLGPHVIYCMNKELCGCFDISDTQNKAGRTIKHWLYFEYLTHLTIINCTALNSADSKGGQSGRKS